MSACARVGGSNGRDTQRSARCEADPDTNETDPPVALVLSPALMESLPARP